MKNLIYYLIIGALTGIICAIFNLPVQIIWAVLITVFLFIVARMLYIVMYSKNLKAIGKFIDQNKTNPVYLYLHFLREGTTEQQREALNLILTKYPNTKYEAVYGVVLGMLNNNIELAKSYNASILHREEGQYMEIILDIMDGKKIMQPIPTFKKEWMNNSIKTHQAFMQKDGRAFDKLVEETLLHSRGIQYYGNYYTFKKLRHQL